MNKTKGCLIANFATVPSKLSLPGCSLYLPIPVCWHVLRRRANSFTGEKTSQYPLYNRRITSTGHG
ncbi:hypothetical protein DN597_26530 [Enterobacter cloacae]|nr:hypothetical protein DN597_26530 [Enterobacter cloacae]